MEKKKKFKVKEININNKPRIIDSKFGSGLSTNFNIILTFFKCLILLGNEKNYKSPKTNFKFFII